MVDHHLPPEETGHHHHKGEKAVHADDLKPARRRGFNNYYYGGHAAGHGGAFRTLCFVLLVIILLAGITALILYLVYRPSTPTFAVTSVAVYSLANATAPPAAGALAGPGPGASPALMAASFQVTLVIRNPSGRSAATYDTLTAYVAYRGEPITGPASLPPLAQEPRSAVAVAPVVGAGAAVPVPVSPDAAAALSRDVAYGVVSLRVVLLGRVRYVSGPFRSGWRSLYARCDLLVGVRKQERGREAPLFGNPSCDVN
ncbi:NDR1/HIN1-like protein 1 [Brachypodium distachyon]|uniref:Late embryogenesis abundant protein LEA-2 subgroup domain-containing protein n=1 Tax=Brachypodium distachyon TaxID=15368 RepID=I1HK52_BRADI|nr:NDR1/HIN1-like protein 1 [Brachypodium distachyon]KQK06656.1 hypothetical protein BRADI_2g27687v3 [Brachypodium distachyon]|eukprot:XP_003566326.1 NDR1/HIN1-like protein 1 [Brachypodium distachyon]